jgi:hypothetical protein
MAALHVARDTVDQLSVSVPSVVYADVHELTPEEAELAKLFTNSWRYLKFAAANQLWMMANDYGLDFERIRHAITYDYPRAADLPGLCHTQGTLNRQLNRPPRSKPRAKPITSQPAPNT